MGKTVKTTRAKSTAANDTKDTAANGTKKTITKDTEEAIKLKIEIEKIERLGKELHEEVRKTKKELDEAKKAAELNKSKANEERVKSAQRNYDNAQSDLRDYNTTLVETYNGDTTAWAMNFVPGNQNKGNPGKEQQKNYNDEIEQYACAVEIQKAAAEKPNISNKDIEAIVDNVEDNESIKDAHAQKVTLAMTRYDKLTEEEQQIIDYCASKSMQNAEKNSKNPAVIEAAAVKAKIDFMSDDNYMQNIKEAETQYKTYTAELEGIYSDDKYKADIEHKTEKLIDKGMSPGAAERFSELKVHAKVTQRNKANEALNDLANKPNKTVIPVDQSIPNINVNTLYAMNPKKQR